MGFIKLFFLNIAALSMVWLCGCGQPDSSDAATLVAGIPPAAYLVQRIAGDNIQTVSALPEGRSPHDFSPPPAAVRRIAGAKVFFHINMPFEKNIIAALRGTGVRITDISDSIARIHLEDGSGCHAEHRHSGDGGAALDPHIWLAPDNCKKMAAAIARELTALMPEKAELFQANLIKLNAELDAVSAEMQIKLRPYRGRSFFVHHPAFGYYAAAAGLKQEYIELGGREPSPARMAEIINKARQCGAKTIFVQMQFNPAAAAALAEALNGETVELDPLAGDLLGNLRRITGAAVKGFER